MGSHADYVPPRSGLCVLLKLFLFKQNMSSFVTIITKLAGVTTSIGHFICVHDTRGLHYNGSVFMLEGERLLCDGRQCFIHFYRARKCVTIHGETPRDWS